MPGASLRAAANALSMPMLDTAETAPTSAESVSTFRRVIRIVESLISTFI
jgi:hypothetical protein